MKTLTYSQAVNNELAAIAENSKATAKAAVKKRSNVEALAAVGTLVAIIAVFVILNHFGFIREF